MNIRPSEFEIRIAASPLVSICDHDKRLHRFINNTDKYGLSIDNCRKVAASSLEYRDLVDRALAKLGFTAPIRAIFVDGIDGVETDFPEFVRVPVLMIIPKDMSGEIYPTVQ